MDQNKFNICFLVVHMSEYVTLSESVFMALIFLPYCRMFEDILWSPSRFVLSGRSFLGPINSEITVWRSLIRNLFIISNFNCFLKIATIRSVTPLVQ
uniref:Uncharacterized protein n=1 Tax=Lepeophtheirus salmonis TaxID=72036 RepID=A0A0K2U245_LEPSM